MNTPSNIDHPHRRFSFRPRDAADTLAGDRHPIGFRRLGAYDPHARKGYPRFYLLLLALGFVVTYLLGGFRASVDLPKFTLRDAVDISHPEPTRKEQP